MKKNILFAIAFLMAGFLSASAQNEFVNDGALVTATNGALITVQGEMIVRDDGANNGVLNNSGTIDVTGNLTVHGACDFNNTGGTVNVGGDVSNTDAGTVLTNAGTINNAGNWSNDADALATIEGAGETITVGNFTNSGGATLDIQSGGTYRVGGNWTNDATFTSATDGTVEFNGDATQAYNHTGNSYMFGTVIINSPEVNAASADFTVMPDGELQFLTGGSKRNIITTGASNFVFMECNGATKSSVTGFSNGPGTFTSPDIDEEDRNYVIGNFKWRRHDEASQLYAFPVGENATIQLMQLEFPAGALTNAGIETLEATYDAASRAPDDPDVSISDCPFNTDNGLKGYTGQWDWSAKDGGGADVLSLVAPEEYALTIYPRGESIDPGNNDFYIEITHDDVNWALRGNGASNCAQPAGPVQLTVSLNEFSKGGGLQAEQPLPVEYLAFAAEPLTTSILVNWVTASETQSAYFDVERSTDGVHFETVKPSVPAQGNSTQAISYSFEDVNVAFNQRYYYRLKQVDLNGAYEYTEIVDAILRNDNTRPLDVKLYPNPTSGNVTLGVSALEAEGVSINIYDGTGRIVARRQLTAQPGYGEYDFTPVTEGLAAGVYHVVITSGKNVSSHRLMKQ